MPMFVTLFRYQPAALKLMVERPENRAVVVSEAAESLGGRLVGYYWMLGHFDGLAILDLPDSGAAAEVQLVMAGTGAVRHVETHELFPAETLPELMQQTARVSYMPPGG